MFSSRTERMSVVKMSDRKTYVCKRTRMAAYLMEKGYQPYRISPDRDNPVYSVYLFTASPELYEAVIDHTTRNNIKKVGTQNEKHKESI